MNNIFDSHAHYDDEKFDPDREQLLASLPDYGIIGIINCGADLKSSEKSLLLAKRFDYIYCACGIHPHEADETGDGYQYKLYTLLEEEKCVAVGEIGLDYHYDFSPRPVQLRIFEEQLQIAKEKNLPVIVHDREAHEDVLFLLNKYKPSGVVHCFSGSIEMAKQVIELGMYIGLGGAVTFKNARKPCEVASNIPLERLLLETDAPYMTPEPNRGKRCDSRQIEFTAKKIAELRGMLFEDLLEISKQNIKRLFEKI